MITARSTQICLEATSFYHCYVRCVRRAFLCGADATTGANFDHRKQWIVSRLTFLSYIFSIDICAYAIMSNHYHVVLHVDKARALEWTREEVVERWLQLYNGHPLVNRWLVEPGGLDKAQLAVVCEIIETWRERLYSIDWFMRGVNETIARMANGEENCKGRFWESRYKSQALLDEAALLSCMAYVDLNPVRAGIVSDLQESDFTSIQQRLADYIGLQSNLSEENSKAVTRVEAQQQLKMKLGLQDQPEATLMPFDGSAHTAIHVALPFTREDYFDVVDKTGRAIREDKRGFIKSEVPSIVVQLGINPEKWLTHIRQFGLRYGHAAGSVARMCDYAKRFCKRWSKGIRNSYDVYLGSWGANSN